MPGYLYILQSQRNNRFYIGSTNNLSRRLNEHKAGKARYTRLTRPWIIVYRQKFASLKQARQAELKLKKQKSRIIIENLIRTGSSVG